VRPGKKVAFWPLLAAATIALVPICGKTAFGQQFAPGTVAITATSGNVAAATASATLAGTQNRTTYLCGLFVSGLGATSGAAVLGTVTGVVATTTFNVGVPAGATVPITPHVIAFLPCIPATALNTNIVVSVPSFGAGNTNASVLAWGVQAP
jgi:hypothetical protein